MLAHAAPPFRARLASGLVWHTLSDAAIPIYRALLQGLPRDPSLAGFPNPAPFLFDADVASDWAKPTRELWCLHRHHFHFHAPAVPSGEKYLLPKVLPNVPPTRTYNMYIHARQCRSFITHFDTACNRRADSTPHAKRRRKNIKKRTHTHTQFSHHHHLPTDTNPSEAVVKSPETVAPMPPVSFNHVRYSIGHDAAGRYLQIGSDCVPEDDSSCMPCSHATDQDTSLLILSTELMPCC